MQLVCNKSAVACNLRAPYMQHACSFRWVMSLVVDAAAADAAVTAAPAVPRSLNRSDISCGLLPTVGTLQLTIWASDF